MVGVDRRIEEIVELGLEEENRSSRCHRDHRSYRADEKRRARPTVDAITPTIDACDMPRQLRKVPTMQRSATTNRSSQSPPSAQTESTRVLISYVVDVEAKGFGRRVQVGAVDEDRQALVRIKMHDLNPLSFNSPAADTSGWRAQNGASCVRRERPTKTNDQRQQCVTMPLRDARDFLR